MHSDGDKCAKTEADQKTKDALQAQVNSMQAAAKFHAQQLLMAGNSSTVQAQTAAQQTILHAEAAMQQKCEQAIQEQKQKVLKEAEEKHAAIMKLESEEKERLQQVIKDAEEEAMDWQSSAFKSNAQYASQ